MADITKSKISGSSKRTAQAIDVASEKLQRQVDELFNNFFKRYSSLISTQRDIDLVKAARINEEARVLVKEAGLDEVLEAYLQEFPKLQRKSLKYFSEIGLDTELSEMNLSNLSVFANTSVAGLEAIIDRRLLLPLEEGILNGVVGNLDDSQIVTDLMNIQESLSTREIDNFFGDTYNTFSQVVNNAKATELGMSLFKYSGPYDAVTSAACREILTGAPYGVPGLYLKADIHNGMAAGITSPNVFANGAHYNCRHEWIPVTLEYAEALGAKIPKSEAKNIAQQEAL